MELGWIVRALHFLHLCLVEHLGRIHHRLWTIALGVHLQHFDGLLMLKLARNCCMRVWNVIGTKG